MRARNVKPGIFTNEELVSCGEKAMLLFIGLWMLADRDGRLEDRPIRIRAQIFPYSQPDVDTLLAVLAGKGFIVRYQIDGLRYIAIPKFKEHQNPHPREKSMGFPPPPGEPCNFTAGREKALPGREESPLWDPSSPNNAMPGAQSPRPVVAVESSCAQSRELTSLLVERGYPPHAVDAAVARIADPGLIREVCRYHRQEHERGNLDEPLGALRSMLREPAKWLIVQTATGWQAPGKPAPRLGKTAEQRKRELEEARRQAEEDKRNAAKSPGLLNLFQHGPDG